MKKIIIGIVVILLSFTVDTQAQKTWTLEDCIRYAQEKNITIKRKELNTQAYKSDLLQSRLNLLPSISAGATHNIYAGRALNSDNTYVTTDMSQSGEMGATAQVTLFNGFQNLNAISKAKLDLLQSLSDLDKAKNDMSINVASAYLEILYCEELLQVAKNQLDLSKLQVEKNKKLVEVGNVAKGTLLDIKAQAARDQASVTSADNNLKVAYLSLTQILELDSAENFTISKPDSINIIDQAPLMTIQEIYAQALLNMPEIKSSEYQLSSMEKSLAIAKGQLSPSLSLSGSYYSSYYDFNEDSYMKQLRELRSKSLSLSLTIPIFNKYSSRNQINKSKIQVIDAQYYLLDTKKTLYKAIQQAHADAINAYQNYISRSEAVLSSEEAFKYTQQKFDVGLSNALDYNTAKTNLIKAKSDLIQAKYEYIFKIKILDFYRGASLKI